MIDDPRVKILLKRYPKGSAYFDATIDLDDIPIDGIRQALRISESNRDARPRPLDAHAIHCFSRYWPTAFDTDAFDYFVHLYRRKEADQVPLNLGDAVFQLPPEDGPPTAIPLPEGTQWLSVRPAEDGLENYQAVEIDRA